MDQFRRSGNINPLTEQESGTWSAIQASGVGHYSAQEMTATASGLGGEREPGQVLMAYHNIYHSL